MAANLMDTLQKYASNPALQQAVSGATTVANVGQQSQNLDLKKMQDEYFNGMQWAKVVAAVTVGAMIATMISCYFSYKISNTQQKMLALSEDKMGRKTASNPRRRVNRKR